MSPMNELLEEYRKTELGSPESAAVLFEILGMLIDRVDILERGRRTTASPGPQAMALLSKRVRVSSEGLLKKEGQVIGFMRDGGGNYLCGVRWDESVGIEWVDPKDLESIPGAEPAPSAAVTEPEPWQPTDEQTRAYSRSRWARERCEATPGDAVDLRHAYTAVFRDMLVVRDKGIAAQAQHIEKLEAEKAELERVLAGDLKNDTPLRRRILSGGIDALENVLDMPNARKLTPAGEQVAKQMREMLRPHLSFREDLAASLSDVLTLARIKWGNLDPDATAFMGKAEALLRVVYPPSRPR